MAILDKDQFTTALDDNIKTSAGQDKTTGSKLRQLFVHVRDKLYQYTGQPFEVDSIQTSDPSDEDSPVVWRLGDKFDPEFAVNIDENKVIQVELDGVVEYIPVLEIATSIDPEGEFNGVRTVDFDYSVQAGDELILVDASERNIEVQLRNPATTRSTELTVKRIDNSNNTVTVITPTGKIDGNNSAVIDTQYTALRFRHNNTNYYII